MTNWKVYTITRVSSSTDFLRFYLDGNVSYSNNNCNDIAVIKVYPFTDCRAGDKIEIDTDRARYYINKGCFYLDEIEARGIVRKFGEVVPSSSAVALPSVSQNQVNTIIGQINSAINTDERNEYEAKIHVDSNSGKYSGFSIIGRRK